MFGFRGVRGGWGGEEKEKKKNLTDVAVQEPHAWIVGPERNGQVAPAGQESHVPPRGVLEVEGPDAGVDVVRRRALGEDDEVVAVEVDRVGVLRRDLEGEPRKVLRGDDEVDVTLRVVLRDHGVFRVEGGVVEVQDRRVGKIEPIYVLWGLLNHSSGIFWITTSSSFVCIWFLDTGGGGLTHHRGVFVRSHRL